MRGSRGGGQHLWVIEIANLEITLDDRSKEKAASKAAE